MILKPIFIFFSDQRGRGEPSQSCQRQKERFRREHHRQEVQLQVDGTPARTSRTRVTNTRLAGTHAQH